MARIRTIKPEIWQSQDFMELSPAGQLTFLALITLADDEGRLKTDAKHLTRVAVRDFDPAEIQEQLDLMASFGMICQYRVDGRSYIALAAWPTHQKVDHPKASVLPCPPQNPTPNGASREDSRGFANVREDSPEPLEASRTFAASRAPADRTGPDLTRPDLRGINPVDLVPDTQAARAYEEPPQALADSEPDVGLGRVQAPDDRGAVGPPGLVVAAMATAPAVVNVPPEPRGRWGPSPEAEAWQRRQDAVLVGAMQIVGRPLSSIEIQGLRAELELRPKLEARPVLLCLASAKRHFGVVRDIAAAGHDRLVRADQARGDGWLEDYLGRLDPVPPPQALAAIEAGQLGPPGLSPPVARAGGGRIVGDALTDWAQQHGLSVGRAG